MWKWIMNKIFSTAKEAVADKVRSELLSSDRREEFVRRFNAYTDIPGIDEKTEAIVLDAAYQVAISWAMSALDKYAN